MNYYFFDIRLFRPGHLSVMLVIGNKLGNSVWEGCVRDRRRPTPNATREEKEEWIRSKYEGKEFLLPLCSTQPIGQQLIEAVKRKDMKSIIHLLAYATPKDINGTVSARDLRTALHLSCGMGNLAISQLLIWVRFSKQKFIILELKFNFSWYFFYKLTAQFEYQTG